MGEEEARYLEEQATGGDGSAYVDPDDDGGEEDDDDGGVDITDPNSEYSALQPEDEDENGEGGEEGEDGQEGEDGEEKEPDDPAAAEQAVAEKGDQEEFGGKPKNDNSPAPEKKGLVANVKQGAKDAAVKIKEWSLEMFAELWSFMKTAAAKLIVAPIIKIKEAIELITDAMAMAGGFFPWLWGKIQGGLSFMLGSNPKKKIIDVIIDIVKGPIANALLAPIKDLFKAIMDVVKPLLDMITNMISKVKDKLGKALDKFPNLKKAFGGGAGVGQLQMGMA